MNRSALGLWRRFVPQQAAGGRLALTRWFAVVGALAIGLFSVGMGWLLSGFLATRMLERDAAITRDFVQSVADIQQVQGFFTVEQAAAAPSVLEFFAHVAAMPDVMRANIYATDRRVLWSSRPELIGKTFGPNPELDRALGGRVVVNREDDEGPSDGKDEHQGLADQGPAQYVENYLPVFAPKGRQLIGVIEVYRRPDALFEAIESGQRLIRTGALVGGLFLFVALVWFVRRTERVLDDQRERLSEAETLAAVGEMAAAVAHSIRNPLVSIRTSAELQCETGQDEQGVHAEIIRNADRIELLVRTMLSYSREPADNQARAELGEVLTAAAQRFGPDLATRGIHLELQSAPNLGTVVGAPVVLAQVLNSLLANAAEASSQGGRVELIASLRGGQPRVIVRDHGSGIEPGHLRQVFKPFFTTKPRGLGLGLPLARRIVQRLGGTLEIQSEPGTGTTVTLTLQPATTP